MWRLLLLFAIAELAHCSCPDGYDLVKDGQCRGIQEKRTVWFKDASRIAGETCDKIRGQPVIIRDEQDQSYYKERAPSTNDGFLILGIVCNTKSLKYEWANGSPINFKPKSYDGELDKPCATGNSWEIHPDGYWGYGNGPSPITGVFMCIIQLQQPVPGGNGCDSFADDEEDGVCYQVEAAAQTWKEAQMTCKKHGAELASISNKKANDFVRRHAASRGVVEGLFLGASTQQDGKFGWSDGSVMDYKNYYPGFPKKNFGDCIAMDTSTSDGMWMNIDCASKFPFACIRPERPYEPHEPTCNGADYDEGSIITSPGFPFSASTTCDYFLTAEPGNNVELEILSLEANSCCDSLILYDGYFGGSLIAKLTGIVENKIFTTNSSNVMRVSWQPDGGVNVKGVAMTYRQVSSSTDLPATDLPPQAPRRNYIGENKTSAGIKENEREL